MEINILGYKKQNKVLQENQNIGHNFIQTLTVYVKIVIMNIRIRASEMVSP